MSAYLSCNELTLRRDRKLSDLIGSAVLHVDMLKFTYVVEGGGKTVLRVTNDYTLSQAFLGSFGSFSLGVVDENDALLLAIKHEAGLRSSFVMRQPSGEIVARTTSKAGDDFFAVEGPDGEVLFSVKRTGTLYPTYVCHAGERQIGVVDAKFNGLSEVFNNATRYEIKVASPDVSALERLLLVCAGVYADVAFHSTS